MTAKAVPTPTSMTTMKPMRRERLALCWARRLRGTKKDDVSAGRRDCPLTPRSELGLLPVELRTEPEQPRRDDRRRLLEREAGAPDDVLGRIGIRQVVNVDEPCQRLCPPILNGFSTRASTR